MEKQYGLALAGGGAKGAYQFGVWSALREMNIKIKGVVGTSIGALNGAAIIQDDYEALYELWHNLKASYILNISDDVYNEIRNINFNSGTFSELFDEIKKIIDLEGLDITPLKELIESFVDEDKIRKSGMDFGLVTVSITDREALELFIEDIPQHQLKEYLLATAYLPFFRRERLHGKYYLDGMYYNNLPTNMLVNKGYTDIIEVHLKTKQETKSEYADHINIIEIRPSQPLGRALDFDQSNSRKNIDMGYYDAMRVFKNLAGNQFYFELDMDSSYFTKKFLTYDEDVILKFYNVLGLWSSPQPRGFFEEVIPELIKGLNLEKNVTYLEFIIAAYEYLGEVYEFSRFEIYSFKRFSQKVYERAKINHSSQSDDGSVLSLKNLFSKEQKITIALELMVCQLGELE